MVLGAALLALLLAALGANSVHAKLVETTFTVAEGTISPDGV
jgi:hypothetical protein